MTATDHAWAALGGDPALPSRISAVVRSGTLASPLPVREMARACVGVCALAAAELGARRAGRADVPGVRVDDGAVATAFVSERHLLVDGRAPVSFAPLSRFWRTSDGWVRTHANYPHHRARLLHALGLPGDTADPALLARVLAGRSAAEIEETVGAAGGLAVALRTRQEWARHPQGAAVAGRPLVERDRPDRATTRASTWSDHGLSEPRPADRGRADSGPADRGLAGPDAARPGAARRGSVGPGSDRAGTGGPGMDGRDTDGPGADRPGTDRPGTDGPGTDGPGTGRPGLGGPGADGPGLERAGLGGPGPDRAGLGGLGSMLPAAGLRVLDLTRVIAGPVATRTLALLGADVLRVDPPGLPELADQHTDTGFGKRSATLDLTTDRRTFEELLAAADVVVTGYRPGALDRFGLSPEALAERRPGLVVGQLSAWGAYGPWGGRRGFDSLVQAATGIAVLEGSEEHPGALPAQALDHGTGYLLAAGILRAVTERLDGGGPQFVRLALARTAYWLMEMETQTETEGEGEGDARGAGAAGAPDSYGDPGPWLAETDSALGRLRYALSPVSFAGGPRNWARPPGPWGADFPRWT